MYQKIENIIL